MVAPMKTSQLVLYDRVLESPPGTFDEEVLLGLWMAGRVAVVNGTLPTPCWQWTAYQQNGYPMYSRVYAHRKAFKEIIGPVGSDTVLHHKCGMSLCVRPSHLVPMDWGKHSQLHAWDKSFIEWAQHWLEYRS